MLFGLGGKSKSLDPMERERLNATRILRVADRGLTVSYVGSIVAVYILDAIFFMAWAPTFYLVPVFLLIAVVIRSCAVFSGPIMQIVARMTGVKREARTIRALSIAAGLLCLVPAMSFFAGGHHVQTQGATVAAATTGVSDTNKVSRINTLKGQITRAEENRDAAIAETNKTIDVIVDDGVPGISAADNESISKLRAEIQGYRTKADTLITELEGKIAAIEQEKETVQTAAAEAETRVEPVYAIFAVVGSLTGGADIWALSVLFAFALLVEAIAFFGLGALEGLRKPILDAIKQIEFQYVANAARLEADRLRQQAHADQEIAEIHLRTADTHARAEAIRSGQDADAFDIVQEAQRKFRKAKAEAEAADILRQADDLQKPPAPPEGEVVLTPQQIWGKKGADAKKHKKAAAAANDWIPVDDLSDRFAGAEA